jgi:low temperature requirement protein LtrA
MTAAPTLEPPVRHLRVHGTGEQSTTALELFFDLVYVFAVTQLSHVLIHHLSWSGAAHAAFLLLVIWWAWIYTTWMVNWFDPNSPHVRLVLLAVMAASLLLAAAVPEAFGEHAALFVIAYVGLQVGRNVAGAALLPSSHALRLSYIRLVVWSAGAGLLWFGGLLAHGNGRLAWWIPALLVELAAPVAGYWTPRIGRARTTDWDVEGSHFAERCQGFIIIALGESIVVTGATASDAGLDRTVVISLLVAFVETAALWWLYFGAAAIHSRRMIAESDDAGRIARDAYTYLHLPIIAGIIVVAVGDDLLLAEPHRALGHAGALMVAGGPALYLLGETLFRVRMIRSVNPKRITAIVALCALYPVAPHVSALVLTALATALVTGLAFWESAEPVRARPH